MSTENDLDIHGIFEELNLETAEKRENFLKFDYQEVNTDYSKFLKLTTITSKIE